jgi:thiosulfate/3-mercaptopyruvate sulfurtransferase
MPRASRPATKSAAGAGVARREPAQAYSTLIGTADLARHLGDAAFVIVDVRHDLANPDSFGVDAYAKAHIPGAAFAHVDDDERRISNVRSERVGVDQRRP